MHRTNFIHILLIIFFTIFCTLMLFFYNILYTYLILRKCIAIMLLFFLTIFCTLMPFFSFFMTIFCALMPFLFDNILYTYLILKKCIAPISFLSCYLFFFDNILYTYLIRLQTEYPNFHANSATLISM